MQYTKSMFDQLFGSKTRVKLLSLFLNNPGRPYYVREITRKIDEQINSVRRELSNLLSIGIIKSTSANNKLYYEVDETYEYFEPLRQIFTTVQVVNKKVDAEIKEEDTIATKLKTTGQVELAWLTGSFVRDDIVGVDIVVVGDVNKAKLAKVIADIESDEGRELNYTSMTVSDYQYRVSLNDRFLGSVMAAKRITLVDNLKSEQK